MTNTNERRSDFPFDFYYNDYYTTRYEVCETGTNEKLEEFELRLSDAVDYAKQHLDKKPYIIEVRYYVEAETEEGVVDEEEIVWKYDEAEDVDLCGHCGRPFKKTELLYNYKKRKLPVCNWCKDKDLFQDVEKPEWAKLSFQPGASGYSDVMTEAFEEKTIYVVHSDADENNILQDFDDLSAALEYAKDNIDELTYIEEVVMNPESEEIYSTEVIWSYDEDDAEEQVICEWCHELAYESECRKELNLGLICRDCQSALYSRGEKPVFEEAYDSDYAEGDDIFAQDFPEAKTESKYNLEESAEPKWNIGSNKLVDRDSVEYQYLEKLAARLQEERPCNEDGDRVFYEVGRTYEDYGAGMEWYTIIVNDPNSIVGSYQLLYPNQWIRLANTGDVEGVLEDILRGSQLTEFLDADINIGLDGGDNNAVRVLSSYDPDEDGEQLEEFLDADINIGFTGGTGNNVGVLSPLGEGINLKSKEEQEEFNQLCKEIGITKMKDLASFKNEVGCTDENILQALRDYRAELGPDFEIKNEAFDTSVAEENKNLSSVTVAELKKSLDAYGDFIIDLVETVEESDEDGWRGASEFIIVATDNGYEGYYAWLDQEGEVVDRDPVLEEKDFENLLYAIDGVYTEVTDLEEYIGSELAEALEEATKMTRDEMIEKEGTDNVDLINAGREEEDRVELEESQAQEISREYEKLSKKYGIDFEDLVYGEEGFMKTNYPENFPDFAGDVIYSEKYWNELVDFAKEKGIELN